MNALARQRDTQDLAPHARGFGERFATDLL
ncbi:hypothetical protein ABIA03_001053 [Bradyrhizobium yuanmingense]|uniref:Uncharacterized protein n=1 Tax=Bradyrhizobium yuanmingense TaxID=108015 RepID=A0ABV4GMD3_9BRAD